MKIFFSYVMDNFHKIKSIIICFSKSISSKAIFIMDKVFAINSKVYIKKLYIYTKIKQKNYRIK